MDLDRVHINPVAPDPRASGRYGSREERSNPEREPQDELDLEVDDRIEISDKGRRTFIAHVVPPDFDFARKALGTIRRTDEERTSQLAARIESGYYNSPVILEQVVARMVGR